MNDYINLLCDICLLNDDKRTHLIKAANAQRILELSRSNRKRAAKTLFNELERKEGCLYPKDVKAAIYASHEMPEHLMYDSFLLDMRQMVATIFETFRTPFLLALANAVSQYPGIDLRMDVFPLRYDVISFKTKVCAKVGTHADADVGTCAFCRTCKTII